MEVLTKTERINRHLLQKVTLLREQGKTKLPTEKEICKQFDTSRGTVRRVMDEFVNAGVFKRIAGKGTFIEEHRDPRIVRSGKIPVVGMAYDLVDLSEFRTKIIKSISKAAQLKGFEAVVCSVGETLSLLDSWLPTSKGLAELVGFISCSFTDETIRILNEGKRNIPYVALVDPKYAKIAKYAVLRKEHYIFPFRYLIKLGHRNICLVERQMNSVFLSKMQNAIKAINSEVKDFKVITKESFYDPMKVDEEIRHIVSLPKNTRPTAILCHDDKTAMWVLKSLRKMKVKVPEEMSVLGVGNMDFSALAVPALTTISTSYDRLGEEAIDLFIKQLNRENIKEPIRYVDYHIVERETCCQVAAG